MPGPTDCNYECCVFVTLFSGWEIWLHSHGLQITTLGKLIKKEWLERFKGRDWSGIVTSPNSVNIWHIFIKFSAYVHWLKWWPLVKFQLICIMYGAITHNSILKKVFIITAILRKINEIKTLCFDTFVHEFTYNKYFEILKKGYNFF